jgi:hypothetical protein
MKDHKTTHVSDLKRMLLEAVVAAAIYYLAAFLFAVLKFKGG